MITLGGFHFDYIGIFQAKVVEKSKQNNTSIQNNKHNQAVVTRVSNNISTTLLFLETLKRVSMVRPKVNSINIFCGAI